jgi:hypothetical protein
VVCLIALRFSLNNALINLMNTHKRKIYSCEGTNIRDINSKPQEKYGLLNIYYATQMLPKGKAGTTQIMENKRHSGI